MGMSFREARGRGDLASSKIGLRKALLTTCVLSQTPPAPAAEPLPVETGISGTPFRLVWLGTDREAVDSRGVGAFRLFRLVLGWSVASSLRGFGAKQLQTRLKWEDL